MTTIDLLPRMSEKQGRHSETKEAVFLKAYLLSHTLKHHGFRCFWPKNLWSTLAFWDSWIFQQRAFSQGWRRHCSYGHCIPKGASILDPGEKVAGLIGLHFVAEEGWRRVLSPGGGKRRPHHSQSLGGHWGMTLGRPGSKLNALHTWTLSLPTALGEMESILMSQIEKGSSLEWP